MAKKIFAVYDAAVSAYKNPFFMDTSGQAIRGWIDVVNDEKTEFNKHPDDFTLFELGEYDELNGVFENHNTPISHGTALKYIQDKRG